MHQGVGSRARRVLAGALLLATVAGLSACSSPDQSAADFAAWAGSQEFVASVDAHPLSGTAEAHSLSAHVVVDGAIDGDGLQQLSTAAWEKASALGISSPEINFIVGNAWGFSVDEAGGHAGTINELRDDPAFVGATIEYQPLDDTQEYTGGVRGTVGSQAALRGAIDALAAAVVDNGGSVDGVAVSASTADGAFGILGEGGQQPLGAIQLWQAISGRVMLSAAQATLVADAPEQLEVTVGSAEDQATAEGIGAQYPAVALTVSQ